MNILTLDNPRKLETLLLQLPDLHILNDRIGGEYKGGFVFLPPALLRDLPEMDHPDQVLPVGFGMPFFYPLHTFPRHIPPIVEADIHTYIEIVRQLVGCM